MLRPIFIALAIGLAAPPLAAADGTAAAAAAQATPFQLWLQEFRSFAAMQGLSPATLNTALNDLQPLAQVLDYDRRQPEFIDTFLNYLDSRVNDRQVTAGQARLAEQQALLADLERRYGIPPRYLVALWGLETQYGRRLGETPVIAALATLAFDGRRAAFFRDELLAALSIIEGGDATVATLVGSWAGAMGQMQFIPSTFLHHAVDADGDGRRDLWHSLPDAMASAANYLKQAGWRAGEDWGREVRLAEGFDWRLADLTIKKSLREWSGLGVTGADGKALPAGEQTASILLPQGHDGPAFLVEHNFEVLLDWNRSLHYALTVGHLADRLAGQPTLRTGRQADNRRLGRGEMMALQQALARLGYDPGEADGIPGRRTCAAIRVYQSAAGLPADGYPSPGLLEHLQGVLEARVRHGPTDTPTTPVNPDGAASTEKSSS